MDSSQVRYSVSKDVLFKFGFEFGEIFVIFYRLSAVIYSRESILPVLFKRESCDSPHYYSTEWLVVRIVWINFRLSFNTESRYSPNCLVRRVTTPRIVYSGESLFDSGELLSKTLKDSPSFKGTMKQTMNYACSALFIKNILKE